MLQGCQACRACQATRLKSATFERLLALSRKLNLQLKAKGKSIIALHDINWKWYTVNQITAIPITLSDLECHLPTASLSYKIYVQHVGHNCASWCSTSRGSLGDSYAYCLLLCILAVECNKSILQLHVTTYNRPCSNTCRVCVCVCVCVVSFHQLWLGFTAPDQRLVFTPTPTVYTGSAK